MCREVVILNRSYPRAEALAAEFPEVKAELRLMPDLMRSVAESDVVFTASSSEHVLVNAQDLQDMPSASAAVGSTRRCVGVFGRGWRAVCVHLCACLWV